MRQFTQDPERGATIITFALFLTVLLGFVGLGVDGAAFYAKQQEAQNGADAGALAIAQRYAVDGCVEDVAMASAYARDNATWGTGGHVADDVDCATSNRVTVDTSATFPPFFTQVIGIDSLTARGSATVEWGSPQKGTPLLPVTFSVCDFNAWDGESTNAVTLYLPKSSTAPCNWGPDGNVMPGGFGYLGDGCRTFVSVDGWVGSQNGNTPKNCDETTMRSYVGQTILLPIFDRCRTGQKSVKDCTYVSSMSPSAREYHIRAFAAWRLDSFYFSNKYSGGAPAPCSEPNTCVRGSFVEWVELGQDFEIGPAPTTDTLIIRFAG